MAEFGLTAFFYALSLLVAEAIHLLHSPRRTIFPVMLPISVIVILGVSFAIPEFSGNLVYLNALMHFLLFALSAGAALLCFQDTVFHTINKCVFGWLTLCCAFVWTWLIEWIFGLHDWRWLVYLLCVVANYGIFLTFSLLNHKRYNSRKNTKREARGFGMQLAVIEAVAIIVFSFVGMVEGEASGQSAISLLVFVIVYLCFGLLNAFSDEKRLTDESRILAQMHEKERQQYEMSKEYMDMINIKSHDLKHILYGLKEKREPAAGEGGAGTVDEEMQRIDSLLKDYDSEVKTGCEALDIVLTEKSGYCARHSIQFTPIADGSLLSFMDPADIYSLVGNILDNAIEAVAEAEEEKRMISLYMEKESGVAHLRVENYSPVPVMFSQGLPVTTKKDKFSHGYGTKSIRHTAEKYEGVATFKQSGSFFLADIIIPVPETGSGQEQKYRYMLPFLPIFFS